jgi:dihydrofolate reductase
MSKISSFMSVTMDGYFTGENGDYSWAHDVKKDPEWDAYVAGNAKGGGGALLFGRITYEIMASFWPSPQAMKMMPDVAEGMNNLSKFVFSRTLDEASWKNTTLVKGDMVAAVRKMKQEGGKDMTILGSGSIVSQLTQAGLIDAYTIVVIPVVIGKGRTMFDGVKEKLKLQLTTCRSFANGNVVLSYDRSA